jgi:copper chaperone
MPAAATPPREYSVQGMTCEHCVMSVREEVTELAGIAGVDVDLAAARLTVTGTDLDDDAIIAAVAEAGYQAVTA